MNYGGMELLPMRVIKTTVMVNNKNPDQRGLKDARQGNLQDDRLKDKNRDVQQDDQRDTSRKGDKTGQSRKDQHGKK